MRVVSVATTARRASLRPVFSRLDQIHHQTALPAPSPSPLRPNTESFYSLRSGRSLIVILTPSDTTAPPDLSNRRFPGPNPPVSTSLLSQIVSGFAPWSFMPEWLCLDLESQKLDHFTPESKMMEPSIGFNRTCYHFLCVVHVWHPGWSLYQDTMMNTEKVIQDQLMITVGEEAHLRE